MPISPPVKITVPFATSGLKNAIPANTNNVTGNAGYDAGFGAINMTPKTAGGIPPFGQDFNGIFFDVTTAIRFLEAGGSFPFDSAFAAAVGGYPLGALVSRSDGSGLWRNTVANNITDPETFGAGWQPEDAGSTTITMTNANVTLTSLQAARSLIIITGTLTANLQLIFPTYIKQWQIVNNCTGAFTITMKTASGSGISVATSIAQCLYGDGTNILMSETNLIRTVKRQIFTISGTYTPSSGMVYCEVELIGGGGGGGGTNGVAAQSAGAAGGGGGGYTKKIFTASAIGASKSVAIGAAGSASAVGAASGGTGGNSVFGSSLLVANGGGGGTGGISSAGSGGNSQGGDGGTGGGGDVNGAGQSGFPGFAFGAGGGVSGAGGSSMYGSGGKASFPGSAGGFPGIGFGSGGSGSASTTVSYAGGAGAAGICIITEYCTQ